MDMTAIIPGHQALHLENHAETEQKGKLRALGKFLGTLVLNLKPTYRSIRLAYGFEEYIILMKKAVILLDDSGWYDWEARAAIYQG